MTLYTTHGAFPELVHISLGVLDDETDAKPSHHIFVGSKAKWYEITDGLPRYDRWGGRWAGAGPGVCAIETII